MRVYLVGAREKKKKRERERESGERTYTHHIHYCTVDLEGSFLHVCVFNRKGKPLQKTIILILIFFLSLSLPIYLDTSFSHLQRLEINHNRFSSR